MKRASPHLSFTFSGMNAVEQRAADTQLPAGCPAELQRLLVGIMFLQNAPTHGSAERPNSEPTPPAVPVYRRCSKGPTCFDPNSLQTHKQEAPITANVHKINFHTNK